MLSHSDTPRLASTALDATRLMRLENTGERASATRCEEDVEMRTSHRTTIFHISARKAPTAVPRAQRTCHRQHIYDVLVGLVTLHPWLHRRLIAPAAPPRSPLRHLHPARGVPAGTACTQSARYK